MIKVKVTPRSPIAEDRLNTLIEDLANANSMPDVRAAAGRARDLPPQARVRVEPDEHP